MDGAGATLRERVIAQLGRGWMGERIRAAREAYGTGGSYAPDLSYRTGPEGVTYGRHWPGEGAGAGRLTWAEVVREVRRAAVQPRLF